MGDEVQSGKSWSRVAALYAKAVNEDDPRSATAASIREVVSVLDASHTLNNASFIVDMGCGNGQLITGLLSSTKHNDQIPKTARIVAADVSQNFLDMTQTRSESKIREGFTTWDRIEILRWDARDLPEVRDGEISHLLSTFCYFTITGEERALAEAYRTLKPGGIFVETSMGDTEWGYLPQLIKRVRPDKQIPDMPKHWQSVSGVTATLIKAGFKDVQAREYRVALPLSSAQEAVDFVMEVFPYMKPLMADMTEDEVARVEGEMLSWVKAKHATDPVVLEGTAYVGWGSK